MAKDGNATRQRTDVERLPSGRHRLTREAVVASQRGRLLFAVAQAVAERGYGPMTVADIVERAGVSRKTFYEQFPDKEAAFLAAFNTGVEMLLGRIGEAADALPGDADWRDRVRSDWETYLEVLCEEPAFARSLHVEALGAGPALLERRAQIMAMFTERTRRMHQLARVQEPGLPDLPDELFRVHSAGMDELVRDTLRTRGPEGLPELVEPGVRLTFALFGAD